MPPVVEYRNIELRVVGLTRFGPRLIAYELGEGFEPTGGRLEWLDIVHNVDEASTAQAVAGAGTLATHAIGELRAKGVRLMDIERRMTTHRAGD